MKNYLFGKLKLIRFPDKKFGSKNGLSAKEHYKIYQMKAVSQLARYKGCLKII